MKILVTGGAGFIGSHTVDALLAKGHQVRILDNLQQPVHLKGKPGYLPPEAEFILGDVRDKPTLTRALEEIDAVFHFAAYQDYLPDFSTYFHVNAVSTALIYEIIVEKKLPVQKVIVASSQAVLGEGLYACPEHGQLIPDIRLQSQLSQGDWEQHCPHCGKCMKVLPTPEHQINPQNQYALSKHSEEQIAISLGKRYQIPSVALRYSIVQGPRQSFYNAYSGAMRIFSLYLYFGRHPMIYEDGLQTRDFVNIQDVVSANILVLEDARANYQVYNVGGGQSYSVMNFYDKLQSQLGLRQKPIIDNYYRFGDTRHILSDISKLKSLGWKPETPIETSIHSYWEYLHQQTDIDDILDYAESTMKQLNVIRKATP